jgi:hypothetical protein
MHFMPHMLFYKSWGVEITTTDGIFMLYHFTNARIAGLIFFIFYILEVLTQICQMTYISYR